MRELVSRRRRSFARPLRCWLAVIAAVGMVASGVGLASASTVGASTAVGVPATELNTAFANDAGYSPAELAEVVSAAPAEGPQSIVITFQSPNPTFSDAPSPTAAPMTAGEVADAYGLSTSAYSAAEQYFESQGLTVSHVWPDRLSLSLTGNVASVDRAFSTVLEAGTYEGRAVTLPSVAPSLPAGLESEVASVAGLTTGFDEFTLPEMPEPGPTDVGTSVNPTDLITPAIARSIYDISGLYNLTASPTYSEGKGIVLLLWGLGYDPSDLQTFFSEDYPSEFPAPTVVPYPVDGAPSPSSNAVNDPSNGSREMTLDIEWSGSMAPGATLDAVYAPPGPSSNGYSPTDSSMIDALNTAVDPSDVPNVAAISMSFGSADGADATLTSGFESDFAVAAHEKITLFAATGDLGGDAESGCQGGTQPEYPAASPQVVAVGGTSVSLQRGTLGAITGFTESAWSGSGGGFSVQFSAPSWQLVGSAEAPISANGHRGMPDVSATAGYNFLYYDGQDAAGGGTSFATPIWAGMVAEMDALHGSNFGFLTPEIYALGANTSLVDPPFHDITTGSNCLGSAEPGWDTATGWGSPAGVYLYEHFVASFVNLSVAATPSPVAPGGAVTVTATVTNFTSGAPISGLSILLYLSSGGIGGPCAGTFGLESPLSNTSGGVAASFKVPYCYLGASAVATATITGGGYYANVSTSVRVNLLGFDPGLAALSVYPDNLILFVVIMAVCITLGGVVGRRPPQLTRYGSPWGPSSAAPPTAPSAPTTPPAAPLPPTSAPTSPSGVSDAPPPSSPPSGPAY